jgi:RNA polymerase sigma factor (TIGR02999 family)
MHDVTDLLHRCWVDDKARTELFRIVYDHLHVLAQASVNRWSVPLLQPTELVNEAYARIFSKDKEVSWPDRAHFFSFISTVMRHLLIDFNRLRKAAKRGGGDAPASLLDGDVPEAEYADENFLLLELFDELERFDRLAAQVAELHYCGGRSFREIVDILAQSRCPVTLTEAEVGKRWRLARAWLESRLTGGGHD